MGKGIHTTRIAEARTSVLIQVHKSLARNNIMAALYVIDEGGKADVLVNAKRYCTMCTVWIGQRLLVWNMRCLDAETEEQRIYITMVKAVKNSDLSKQHHASFMMRCPSSIMHLS